MLRGDSDSEEAAISEIVAPRGAVLVYVPEASERRRRNLWAQQAALYVPDEEGARPIPGGTDLREYIADTFGIVLPGVQPRESATIAETRDHY